MCKKVKFFLSLFLISAVLPVDAFAKCNGNDIATDYFGETYGCNCDNGDVMHHSSKGTAIMSPNAGKIYKCDTEHKFKYTGLVIGLTRMAIGNDVWNETDGGWCPDNPTDEQLGVNKDKMITIMDEVKKCWRKSCPTGTYFPAGTDVVVDYTKCSVCNDIKQTISGGICYEISCDTESGKNVIYNGKCMPVCDLKTAGAEYTSDPSYISIKIKGENAGSIGEIENENKSCTGLVHAATCSNGVIIKCVDGYKLDNDKKCVAE